MAEIWLEMVVKRQFVSLLLFVTPSIMKNSDIFKNLFRGLRNAREKTNTLHHIHADSGHHFPAKIVIERRNNYVISQLQFQLIT